MTDVIEAASAGVRDMADGSLRITLEFEPRHARAAYSLFGQRGTPVAVAALKVGAAAEAKSDEVEPAGEVKRDKPIAKWLALRCKEPEFRQWVANQRQYPYAMTEDECATAIREWFHVESRGDIDGDPIREAAFAKLRGRWQKHHLARTA